MTVQRVCCIDGITKRLDTLRVHVQRRASVVQLRLCGGEAAVRVDRVRNGRDGAARVCVDVLLGGELIVLGHGYGCRVARFPVKENW